MTIFRSLLFFLLFTYAYPVAASTVYEYTGNCRQAYNAFLSLNNEAGRAFVAAEKKANPTNLLIDYIADYEDLTWMLFNGNEKELEARKEKMDNRIDMLEKGDPNSPWYRFCKAGVYLHWAAIQGRAGARLRSAVLFRKSFMLLKENIKLFPSFAPNDVIFGMEQAATGAVPENYQWVVSILGIKGNINQGVGRIVRFLNNNNQQGDFLRAEAQFYYAYIKYYSQYQQETVWSYLNSPAFNTDNNLLNVFVKANLGVNYRHVSAALEELQKAQNLVTWKDYPIMDYEMGCALLHQLDKRCIQHLELFVSKTKNGFFVKDALQKTALMWYILGDRAKAAKCLDQIKTSGTEETDADKHAQSFAEENIFPDRTLLKARLLCDGGYYSEALKTIGLLNEGALDVAGKLEYNFRLGRIYDELGDDNKALQCYTTTIVQGRARKEYFAARAALQMGFIYEKHEKTQEAIARYRECLDMKHHDFQASIDQQAKAALSRLGAG